VSRTEPLPPVAAGEDFRPAEGVMARRHVLIVPSWWPSPEAPLAGIFCQEYARAFAAAGARVGVVYPDLVSLRRLRGGVPVPRRPQVTHERLDDLPVVRIRGLHTALGRPALHMWRFRRWLARGLAEYAGRYGRPDLLHAMCAVPAGWAGTHLRDSLAARVVITEHTGPFALALRPAAQGDLVRAAVERAAAVVAVSTRLREEMHVAGLRREILVCGNPVARVFVESPVQPADAAGGRVRLLFVGRLAEEKGLRELADAAAALAAEGRPLEWHFIGDGPLGPELARRFAALGPAGSAVFHGVLPPERTAERMRAAAALVLPSHGESFGLAVAEALCSGLPVAVSAATACAEHVSPADGEVVAPRDPAALAAGLRRLLDRLPSLDRRAIAERARRRFSAGEVAAWYARLFAGLRGDAAAAERE